MTKMESLEQIKGDEFFLKGVKELQNQSPDTALEWPLGVLSRLYKLADRALPGPSDNGTNLRIRQPSFIISLVEDAETMRN